jgi:lipoprotein-anchoring transpeptidase ErfK/SrfK
MRHLAAALALAGALAFALPAVPAAAGDTTPQAIETAASAVEQARRDMAAAFGRSSLATGRHLWKDGRSEVTRVVLDLSRQLAFAYHRDELIAVSTISSGDKEHLSPVGVFPIMEKKRHHRSNRYNDAPMPYMQRLNQWGVALHAGNLPGYPASHGCIRLPNAFAAKLFGATRVGTEVLIAEPDGPPARKA